MRKLLAIICLAAVLPGAAEAGTRNFFKPTVGGDLLAFCASSGATCGKPVADAWCRAIGFEEAINFRRAGGNAAAVARYADTGGLCRGKDCESFRQIKCWNGIS